MATEPHSVVPEVFVGPGRAIRTFLNTPMPRGVCHLYPDTQARARAERNSRACRKFAHRLVDYLEREWGLTFSDLTNAITETAAPFTLVMSPGRLETSLLGYERQEALCRLLTHILWDTVFSESPQAAIPVRRELKVKLLTSKVCGSTTFEKYFRVGAEEPYPRPKLLRPVA